MYPTPSGLRLLSERGVGGIKWPGVGFEFRFDLGVQGPEEVSPSGWSTVREVADVGPAMF